MPQSAKMFRVVLVSALVALAMGAAPRVRPMVPMLDGRIVGGEAVQIRNFPYQVSLQIYGVVHICGASVLSPIRILTAAHCTADWSPTSLSIRAGSSDKNSGGQERTVVDIAQHPRYNAATTDYDVSVLTLASPLELGPEVQPIALHPEGAETATGSPANITGWGTTSSGGSSPNDLQGTVVVKTDDDVCYDQYGGSITDRMVCYGSPGRDSCQGDSGGPLVANGEQVGIVSWGRGCANAKYSGVYTRVAHKSITDHIKNNM